MRILVSESRANSKNLFSVEVADDFNRGMDKYRNRTETWRNQEDALMAAKYLSVEMSAPIYVKEAGRRHAKQLR